MATGGTRRSPAAAGEAVGFVWSGPLDDRELGNFFDEHGNEPVIATDNPEEITKG